MIQTKITLEIHHTKPITEMLDLVAGRAYTLAGVENVTAYKPVDFQAHVARLFVKPADTTGRLVHAAVGVSGEAGELLDAVKKHWIYGKPLDVANLIEEVGDALFYLQALATEAGFTLDEAMIQNVVKLSKRYPEGYTDQAAQERADKVTA